MYIHAETCDIRTTYDRLSASYSVNDYNLMNGSRNLISVGGHSSSSIHAKT